VAVDRRTGESKHPDYFRLCSWLATDVVAKRKKEEVETSKQDSTDDERFETAGTPSPSWTQLRTDDEEDQTRNQDDEEDEKLQDEVTPSRSLTRMLSEWYYGAHD